MNNIPRCTPTVILEVIAPLDIMNNIFECTPTAILGIISYQYIMNNIPECTHSGCKPTVILGGTISQGYYE